jgi:radical SAM superfamily enzyme YgiQ (UPF0313 family)
MMGKDSKILFIFPRWPLLTLWGHFKHKFPPLGLLTIAGLTPPEFVVEFTDENVSEINFDTDADMIAISVMTPLAHRAYEIADRFRAQGKTVVMGGIHVSIHPEEATGHADCVVIGEAEDIWPVVLADYRVGKLKPRYSDGTLINMGREFPIPRRDLLKKGRYVTRSTIQMMRGCPFDCEFCSVTAFSGREFRARPIDSFVEEFRGLPDRFVFIVDDNILSNRKVAEKLFDRMKGIGKWWGSQVTISIADNDALLKKMARAGCKSLFIGFESLDQDNLIQIGKKFVRAHKNEDRIKRIQDHGIGILGSFIVGLDGDDDSVFDKQYEFIIRTRMEAFLISVLTPFPGTHLTRRMEAEGRILSKDWSKYDMNTVVFQPKNFTPDDLQTRYNELNRALYSVGSIARRTLKLRKNMLIFLHQNIGFRNAWRDLERARSSGTQI